MQKVTIGRIVHYALDEQRHRPAIVVQVWNDEFPENADDKDGVNLQVFLDGENDTGPHLFGQGNINLPVWATSVRYSNLHEPGTWHWPEHEGDAHG